MLYCGTSGYSYDDWIGHFYPEGIAKNEMLPFYAREFKTAEINYTYYRMPNARTLGAMAANVPDDFVFSIKAPKELTHEREEAEAAFGLFNAALVPLIESRKLGCILAQFPNSFKPNDENRAYLGELRRQLGDLPVAVEFRNAAWITDATMDLLRDNGLGYCCVDEPHLKGLIPPVAVATAPVGYVRFHGRNAKDWWHHDEAWQRYSYSYSDAEIQEWVPKIQTLFKNTQTTFIYTNNHYKGQSVDTVRQIKALLDAAGTPAA
jgi:uncharacterized protein YecE (DUF72 family)